MSLVTWNPTTKGTSVVLSNANLTAFDFWQYQSVKTTESKSTGSWYLELKIDVYYSYMGFGIIDDSIPTLNNTVRTNNSYYGMNQNGLGSILYTHKSTTIGTISDTLKANDIIGVLLNMDDGEVSFYKNGAFLAKIQEIKTNIVNANIVLTTHSSQDTPYPRVTANFGASNFIYLPTDLPSKTKSFDGTQNLASVTKGFVLSTGNYYYLDSTNKWSVLSNQPTLQDFLDFGISNFLNITEGLWQELQDEVELVYFIDDISIEKIFIKSELQPYSVYDHISDTPEIIIYNESTDGLLVSTTVEPFSVYDYISETPTAIAYTESTDDITVSTTTEPYDLYDEFGNELEVLYYTDDEAVAEADLTLEANWSPIDELEGDLEVVTWTDEDADTAQRVLEMTAVPKPQFVKMIGAKSLFSAVKGMDVIDRSYGYKNNTRFLLTDSSTSVWYTWSKSLNNFTIVNSSSPLDVGMTAEELNSLTSEKWSLWNKNSVNVGIYMYEGVRGGITSEVENVSYQEEVNKYSPELSNLLFYILNTTAKIQIELDGNVLKGEVSDDDMTRVQYRVLLNGLPYFPENGDFTELGAPPANIELILSGDKVKIDEENTIRVEFKDYFGTVDYWQTNFVGMYAGILFKNVYGDYYSTDMGEVLKYLDFGTIIAGQTTIEHEVIIKNQNGFDISNANLKADTSQFPQGLEIEFSNSQSPFIAQPELTIDYIANNTEEPFFVRLKSQLGVTPVASGEFSISAKADKA